ncbi:MULTISPECIES: Omp28-related outer membrane protein [unclassified Lentimicrobium]|uniref:Omp28-related outer membrane protein n=1 Tax=unclassified Lentimicrobium TaxID=2677434 RepID=UPI0015552BD7|nr:MULTISPECIES: Omp28-related outer membrane protein [unclassified Lentimicrobium]NPD44118.1 Omp28-related outer membrane protein [Lentimicrobium sp. S6]NPD86675.1 Omp28-related outer membrane protein [Lentimicrobium sp. L6]
MKKFTLHLLQTTLALFISLGLFAQSNKNVNDEVPLIPLFELFTSSTCPPCAYANPIFDALLEDNPGTYSVIKYQTNFPGAGDPYYTAEVGARTSYYGVSSVPSLYVNSDQMHPNECTQEVYDSYQGQTTYLDIEVSTAEIDPDNNITIAVDLNALADYPAGLKAQVVVVEGRTFENTGSNGELEFTHVMMKMFPDASGTTLPALSNGDTETLNFSYDMSSTNMETQNDLHVIVFVQDDSDKSLVQSKQVPVVSSMTDYTITINVVDANNTPVEGAELFLEYGGVKFTDASGQIMYEAVLPGSYDYEIVASGLIPAEGTIDVVDQDVIEVIIMADPGYYYYEDFTTDIPDSYTVINETGGNYIYHYDGRILFFRQSDDLSPMIMATEQINITPGEKIFFDIGEDSGFPMEMVFGIMSDPTDPESFVDIMTIIPTTEWETYELLLEDLPTEDTDIFFAWKHNSLEGNCSFDNIKINYKEGTETYEVAFNVIDQESNAIEGAEVNLESYGILTTDDLGFINYQDVTPGIYEFTTTKDGYESASGSITVIDDDIFEVVEMTAFVSHYSISYTVLDGSIPLGGAEITIDGETQTTNASGQTTFENYEDGTYDYSISLNGFEAFDDQVIVDGEDVDIEVNLVIDGLVNMNNQKLLLYPNPSSDFMNIKLDKEIRSIALYDMTGELLNTFQVGTEEFKLDVSKYRKGIYLLILNTNEIVITKKVIIE